MPDTPEKFREKKFREAARARESFLAPLEKRLLVRMADATPRWINSDHLTLLGMVSMFFAGLCYWLARWNKYMLLAAMLWLAANWLGDSLDGTLARVRNRQRPRYGFYVDHITDAFGTFFLVGGMGLSGYMSSMVAAVLLISYFMLSIQAYLATYALGTFQLSYWKFSPTELRLLLVAGNVALLFRPMGKLWGYRFPLFDAGGVAGIADMWIMLIVSSIRNTAALYRAERFRGSQSQPEHGLGFYRVLHERYHGRTFRRLRQGPRMRAPKHDRLVRAFPRPRVRITPPNRGRRTLGENDLRAPGSLHTSLQRCTLPHRDRDKRGLHRVRSLHRHTWTRTDRMSSARHQTRRRSHSSLPTRCKPMVGCRKMHLASWRQILHGLRPDALLQIHRSAPQGRQRLYLWRA